jgi:hypothetical protein
VAAAEIFSVEHPDGLPRAERGVDQRHELAAHVIDLDPRRRRPAVPVLALGAPPLPAWRERAGVSG